MNDRNVNPQYINYVNLQDINSFFTSGQSMYCFKL